MTNTMAATAISHHATARAPASLLAVGADISSGVVIRAIGG
jgi:hypothetical protein